MRHFPKIGDVVNIVPKGGTLPFEIVDVDKTREEPILLRHPFSGHSMWFRRAELRPHVRSDHN